MAWLLYTFLQKKHLVPLPPWPQNPNSGAHYMNKNTKSPPDFAQWAPLAKKKKHGGVMGALEPNITFLLDGNVFYFVVNK